MNFSGLRRFFAGKETAAEPAQPVSPDEPDALIELFLSKNKEAGRGYWCIPADTEIGKIILALPREKQTLVVEVTALRLIELSQRITKFRANCRDTNNPHLDKGWNELWHPHRQLEALLSALLKRKLPFTVAQIVLLTRLLAAEKQLRYSYLPIPGIISAVVDLAKTTPLDSELKGNLTSILAAMQADQADQTIRKSIPALQQLLGQGHRLPLQKGEVWSEFAIASIEALPPERQSSWIDLLEHCAQATGTKPSAKWSKSARSIISERIGNQAFTEMILSWFPLVDKPRPPDMVPPTRHVPPPLTICNLHGDILKGLVWCCEGVPGEPINRALTALALSSYKKVPGLGPRLTKVGNACITTLGAAGGLDAIGQLAILKVKVKFGTAQAMLEKALTAAAEKEDLPREELEEMSVPAYGLSEVGRTTLQLGETTAEIHVADSRSVEISWRNAQGKTLRAPPAAVKTGHADDLKELRQMQKDIERMLGAQAERIDQLFLAQKSWPLATWRERYLDHPLVGVIGRRLIWKFQTDGVSTPVLWNEGRIEDVTGELLPLSENTTVSLWHPIDSLAAQIPQWRERLEVLQIRQPFKQAHREIYLLTPAEENTGVYSNRFGAHILKQHQFNALCSQRGWKNKLRLMVDDTYPPAHRLLSNWNIRAEFWIEGAGTDYGTDTNETGTYLYLSTDQVRFYATNAPGRTAHAGGGGYQPWRGQADQPIPLSEIPPLVFSEIMRDVDLFVGVCSVGNDPNWSDGGPQGRFRDYWQNYSFSELSGSATIRKQVLERLVPKLKIAAKCSFTDRFLVVQGSLHEYKIHLGSGNILMSPSDRYLCIVANQSVKTTEKVFLPFEGDQMLSVILSKAFLLANDAAITDTTILRQIKS